MKIIVLHGEDSNKSYLRLSRFMDTAKKRSWEILYNEFPNTPSLFGSERLLIYKDYRLLTKKDIENFEKFDGTLVVYHEHDLPASFIKLMPQDFKMEKYDLPKLLFIFLETLYPGNSVNSIKLLHEVTNAQPPELVMFFIAKHFRDLYWVKKDPDSTGFPSWKAGKLKTQASKLSVEKLELIINKLAEIDIKVKTSDENLLTALDLLIIKELE